jgi:hypothetical protein
MKQQTLYQRIALSNLSKIVVALVLCLELSSGVVNAQYSVFPVNGSSCVGQTQTFVFGGPSCTLSWFVTTNPSDYTMVPHDGNQVTITWLQPTTHPINVGAGYSSCGGSSGSAMSSSFTVYTSVANAISITGPTSACNSTDILTYTATNVQNVPSPQYQWMVNGTTVQSSASNVFAKSGFSNGDVVQANITSSSAGCLAPSNSITVNVTFPITIAQLPGAAVCAGQPAAGAVFQVQNLVFNSSSGSWSFYWYKNNVLVTDNGPSVPAYVYAPTGIINIGDQIKCIMYSSSSTCSGSSTSNVVSAQANTNVIQPVTPMINIGTSVALPATLCTGDNVTFTATPNGSYGLSYYQWTQLDVNNNIKVITTPNNTGSFSTTAFVNGDIIKVTALASGGCLATSNASGSLQGEPLMVHPPITPGVNIGTSISLPVTICTGDNVTFTATPATPPVGYSYTLSNYQWTLLDGSNNILVTSSTGGTRSFSTTAFVTGAIVKVTASASGNCLTLPSASGNFNGSGITVIPNLTPSIKIDVDKRTICRGDQVTFSFTTKDATNTSAYSVVVGSTNYTVNVGETLPITNYNGEDLSASATVTGTCLSTNIASGNFSGSGISFLPKITSTIVIDVDKRTICRGDQVTFSFTTKDATNTSAYSVVVGATNYAVNVGSTLPIPNYNGENVSASATVTGTCLNTNLASGSFSGSGISILPKPRPLDINLSICYWEPIKISPPSSSGETYNWYDNLGKLISSNAASYSQPPSLLQNNFQLQFEFANPGFCPSDRATAQIILRDDCDDKLNWIETQAMDNNGVVFHSKSYFDFSGNALQSQSLNLTKNQVLASNAPLKDMYARDAVSVLPAPTNQNHFQYSSHFVTSNSGNNKFDFRDYIVPSQKNEVSSSTPGTVGWYYSANNTLETNVPQSKFPYSRKQFYWDGAGELMYAAGVGERLRIGSGHETLIRTFNVINELDYYLLLRAKATTTAAGLDLANQAVQTVVRDENGNFAISVADKSGKTILTARKGTALNNTLTVTNTQTVSALPNSPYSSLIYFYILDGQSVSITPTSSSEFYSANVNDLITGQGYDPPLDNLPAGFYQLALTDGEVQVSYTNYFIDVACQFYNDAGRLVSSFSPNGFQMISKGGNLKPDNDAVKLKADYDAADKTTYSYNHRGWLLSMTEPDAGTTQYMYRKDGSIRYSQNAKQLAVNPKRFSYTLYDQIARPIESGEYQGSTYSFSNALNATLDYEFQVQFPSANVMDWVKTHYDLPDPNFSTTTGLNTSVYNQIYVRNAVSWTENSNNKTWYSYDERGRVVWMAQKPLGLPRTFVVEYEYDFLGNVLQVKQSTFLNDGSANSGLQLSTFYHHYEYDADKRLSKAYTSLDGTNKILHASYQYYLHGPLKRIELGGNLQGIDFVYNIHGWLESINHPNINEDPGQDGIPGSTNKDFKPDVFGLLLDYYDSEFSTLFPLGALDRTKDLQRLHHLPNGLDSETVLAGAGSFDNEVSFLRPSENAYTNDYFKSYTAQNKLYKELVERLAASNNHKKAVKEGLSQQ